MGKKVLVTGGCGFLGSHVCEKFRSEGWEVEVLDNLTKTEYMRTGYNIERTRNLNLDILTGMGIPVHVGSITDRNLVRACLDGCQLVVHCAAQPAMTIALEQPIMDFDTNAMGTLNLLDEARKIGAALVNCSSVHVYGNGINLSLKEGQERFERTPICIDEKEEILTGQVTPLHASKMAAELYVRAYADSYGMPTATFRLTGMYGPRQVGGEDHGWVANFAIRTMLDLPIKVFGTDKQVRDILYVKDAAEAFWKWYQARCPSGTYNIGGGKACIISIRECLSYLKYLVGKEQNVTIEAPRLGDLHYFVSDFRKANYSFGWYPDTSPKEGLNKMVDWLRENRCLFQK